MHGLKMKKSGYTRGEAEPRNLRYTKPDRGFSDTGSPPSKLLIITNFYITILSPDVMHLRMESGLNKEITLEIYIYHPFQRAGREESSEIRPDEPELLRPPGGQNII